MSACCPATEFRGISGEPICIFPIELISSRSARLEGRHRRLFGFKTRFKTFLKGFHTLRRNGDFDQLAVIVHPEVKTDGLALWRGSANSQMIQLRRFPGEVHMFARLENDHG